MYHDTVVVPHLGTFRATYVPSKWIEEEEILLPPYRALTFTHEVDKTDTHFVETISANYQISTEEAYILTLEFTENIQQELAEYGNYELGSIGEFVQDEETEQINFIPCQAGVASPWLYGLDAIHTHPIKEKVQLAHNQEKIKKTVNADGQHVTISINKRVLHYVGSVAAAIVLFFTFSTPIAENAFTQQPSIHSEIFFPANIISEPQAKSTLTEEIIKTTDLEKEAEIETIHDEATEKSQAETKKEEPTYSVVLCCGVPVQNANSYCQTLNEDGIKAVVDNSGKVLRVLIPGFVSREDALTEVHSLRSKSKKFANAWIMENK